MYIIQYKAHDNDKIHVGLVRDKGELIEPLQTDNHMYELCLHCIKEQINLQDFINSLPKQSPISYDELLQKNELLPPITTNNPKDMLITGTGLTHLGSGKARGNMHAKGATDDLTDSMKMFNMGLAEGKPAKGEVGVQPEWFYKGNGDILKACGEDIHSPSFALDGGEEPELAGVYISYQGQVYKIGFCIGNEFSDHIMEKQNYLYLAHSKLRECSIGPELYIGDNLNVDIKGKTTITRGNSKVWQQDFLTGEANMSHSIANLEHHHFKYDFFSNSEMVHIHFFGTATLSYQDDIVVNHDDTITIEMDTFNLPLHNKIVTDTLHDIKVHKL